MHPEPDTSAQLATFDPPLASAVVAVLRGMGISAAVEPLDHDEVEVRVQAARREEALAVLASRMEEVQRLAQASLAGGGSPATEQQPAGDAEAEPPIVMERLRRMGLGIAVVLTPLLIITLAGGPLPIGYALALFILGLVAVVYWRHRADEDR